MNLALHHGLGAFKDIGSLLIDPRSNTGWHSFRTTTAISPHVSWTLSTSLILHRSSKRCAQLLGTFLDGTETTTTALEGGDLSL